MSATIDRAFADHLLQCFDDPQQYGVHQLFNAWWKYAPEEVKAQYVADFEGVPEQKQYLAERFYADPLDLEALSAFAPGTLGRAYHQFIVDNGLEKNIAINYRMFHETLESAGVLDCMPEPLKYAVLRGFQLHDFLHVLTGYEASPRGEIALQAFCLAQLRFPYFGMWMSVVTTRMTFLEPNSITPIMDAISEGWTFGRRVKNIQFVKCETILDQPLETIRQRFGISASGKLALAA